MIIRRRANAANKDGYVFERFDNEPDDYEEHELILSSKEALDRFEQLNKESKETSIAGYRKGDGYKVYTRYDNGDISIYTNNPDLI